MALSTRALFGKRALSKLSASDYVDWAIEMLVQGYDSHALCILAGFERSASVFEADDYFQRAVVELGLSSPDDSSAVRAYACEIAQQVVVGQLAGQEGVRALYQICRATEYDRDYLIWLELDDALDSLLAGEHPYTYESATLENFDRVAKQEAEKFIAQMNARAAI